MIKDILHHRCQWLIRMVGTVVLLSYPFLTNTIALANENVTFQEPVKYITEEQLEKLYTCKDETINDTCLVISVEDAEMLMKIAVMEDYTDEYSQAYIMSIILNRVNSPDFPNTVKEVIEQPGQFLELTDKRYINAIPDVNSHLALALIESRSVQTDFYYYEATWVKNSWASRHRKVALEYGESRFYE